LVAAVAVVSVVVLPPLSTVQPCTLPWAQMGLLQGPCACNCGVRTRRKVDGLFNAHVGKRPSTLRGAALRAATAAQSRLDVTTGKRLRQELLAKQREELLVHMAKQREASVRVLEEQLDARQRENGGRIKLEEQLSAANRKITDLVGQNTSLRTAGGKGEW